jgi:hypothetical protein
MKAKNAFLVSASVEGKSWLTARTVLTAQSEAGAIAKATPILKLTPEHVVTVEPVKVFESGAKLESDNYPYGRSRTTAFFSVEFKKNKGFRTVFQTIDPKNGRLNKPKNSTYYSVILPMQRENRHIEYCGYLDFNGHDAINKGLQFMADFYDLFTPEQITETALYALALMKVDFKAQVIYCGSDVETLKPFYTDKFKALVEIVNGNSQDFTAAMLDSAGIEAQKKPDFNPFTVKSVTIGA